jgi:hypothetical protein
MPERQRGINKKRKVKNRLDNNQPINLPEETIENIKNHVDSEIYKFTTLKRKEKKSDTVARDKDHKNQEPNKNQNKSSPDEMESSAFPSNIQMEEHNTTCNSNDDFEIRGETIFRYTGNSLMNFSHPIKLQEEIDKHIGIDNPVVEKAFINNKNKQLYIITSELRTILHLEKFQWPGEAFETGIQTAKPKEKSYFIAVRGVPTTLDIKDENVINKIRSKYSPISEIYRITKKSENKELNLLKIKVTNDDCAKYIINHGLQIGYINYKTEEWRQQIRPKQCRKCNKYGHTTNECLEKNYTCPLCAHNHKLEDCQNRNTQKKIKCSNCQGKHPAFSKVCKIMIDETNKLTKKQQKQVSQKNNSQNTQTNQAQKTSTNTKKTQQATYADITKAHTNTKEQRTEKNYTNGNNTIKMTITKIIANLSTLLTLETLDTSSLEQINKAIENLIARIQNE